MSLSGINIEKRQGSATKAIRFLTGITITPVDAVVPVKVVDYRGRGYANVTLEANNAGGLFSTTTDNNGNALMILDNPITINASVFKLVESYNYTGEDSVTIVLDGKLRE